MNFERYFTRTIWQRGIQYYQQKRIVSFSAKPGKAVIYHAQVRGSQNYFIELHFLNDRLAAGGCTCAYATSGEMCKHMAAVLYGIQTVGADGMLEEYGGQAPTQAAGKAAGVIYPFRASAGDAAAASLLEPFRETRAFFDLDMICQNLAVPAAVDQKAKKLLEKNDLSLQMSFNRGTDWTQHRLRINGQFRSSRSYDYTSVVMNSRELLSLQCYANTACYRSNSLGKAPHCCEHVLALLYQARERLKERPIGSATDIDGDVFLDAYRAGTPSERAPEKSIRLVPRVLGTERDSLMVDVRAGVDRLYVIKDLGALFRAEDARRELPLGSRSSLDFAAQTFTDESAPVAAWFRDVVQDQVRFYPGEARRVLVSPGTLRLNGKNLDSFYELMQNRTADMAKSQLPVTFTAGSISPRVTVAPLEEKGVLLGAQVSGNIPPLCEGLRNVYALSDNRLIRREGPDSELLFALSHVAEGMGSFRFAIGWDALPRFVRGILPAMRRSCALTEREPEKLAAHVPPQACFVFRLDAQDGDVTCDAQVSYAGKSRPLLSPPGGAYADPAAEEKASAAVLKYFEPPAGDGLAHLGAGEDSLYALLTEGTDALSRLGEVLATDAFSRLHIRRDWKLRVGVSLESDLIDLQLLSDELSKEELRSVLAAYAAKKKYHRLPSGDLIDLSGEQMEDLEELFRAAHVPIKEFVSGRMHLPAYRALYLNKLLEEHEEIASNRDRNFRRLARSFKTASEADVEVPSSLQDVLRPYQEQGFRWLNTLCQYGFGGVLADDMGLGKTVQLLTLILHEKESGAKQPSLIVCPSSLMYNWQAECQRFTPQLRSVIIAGSQAERRPVLQRAGEYDLLITSYDLLKRDFPIYEELRFHIAALDEAQFIKNHASAGAKAVKTLHAEHRFALTGTPMENRLSELWSIFDYLMPGFLYPYETFRREMETPIVKTGDEQATRRLRRMVGPFILRRLKTDVLRDLPEKTEETRPVSIEDEQRRLYDAQVARLQDMLAQADAEDFQKNRIAVLAQLTRLRQICCDPSLTVENYKGPSAKREALLDLLRSAIDGGHKVLVFSQFTSMLALIEEDLKAEGIPYMLLTGETPKEERVEMTDRFNRDDTPVFLISLKAGGTGLNLVGADIVVHYDPWWNLAVQHQATDRAHRIGQEKPVSVYKLIARNTIEEKIVKLQESKRELADSILAGDHASLASLSREELMELVEG